VVVHRFITRGWCFLFYWMRSGMGYPPPPLNPTWSDASRMCRLLATSYHLRRSPSRVRLVVLCPERGI
jgi:hypothetical protein